MKKLIIFTQYPYSNSINKELIESFGFNKAMNVKLDAIINSAFSALRYKEKTACTVELHYCDNRAIDFEGLLGKDIELVKQSGTTFLECIKKNFKKSFEQGFENLCFINTNINDLTFEIIHEAFLKLYYNDIVLGPTNDGEIYLLASKYYLKSIFKKLNRDKQIFEKISNLLKDANINCGITKTLINIASKENPLFK